MIIDDGDVAAKVRAIAPEGVEGLLELVGPTACVDSLRALAPGGRACIAGYLEGSWETEAAQAEAQDQLARVDVWRALLAAGVARGDLAPFLSILRQP